MFMPHAPDGELGSPQRLRYRCAVKPAAQHGAHEVQRFSPLICLMGVLLLVTEPVADLHIAACVAATITDRRDVVDGRRQGSGAPEGGINQMTGIPADTAQPAVTFADFTHAERLDGPI